jgi:hypothetical protein
MVEHKIVEHSALQQRLGALSGGLTGLALAAGIWGLDAIGMRQAHMPLYYPSVLLGAAGVVAVGALAGWLAARTSRPMLGALTWLAAVILAMLIAGHLPFEGRTVLAWLADRRFWGLDIYPFDATAQTRLVVASFFPVLALTALGVMQDYRLEGIQSSLNARRLGARAWVLLLLPLPVVVAAGLAADGVVNDSLRAPVAQVAQIIQVASGYSGDLDALSRQTGLNYSAVRGVRAKLSGNYRLMLGDIDLSDEKTVVVVADFDNGAWINCRVLVDRVSFCDEAQAPYVEGLQALLAGQDISQCQDCQLQVSAGWQAWLQDRGRFTGAPRITRLAQWGSYVLMRAANPGSGYGVECMFQGNRMVSLVACREA